MQVRKGCFDFYNNSLETFQMKMLDIFFGLSQEAVCVPPKRYKSLSTMYLVLHVALLHTPVQFSSEMKAVLNDESSWFMDAV